MLNYISNRKHQQNLSLRKNCPNTEFFWSVFSCIWTEYRDLRSKFPYSVQIRENADQKNSAFGHFSRSLCNILVAEVRKQEMNNMYRGVFITQSYVQDGTFRENI